MLKGSSKITPSTGGCPTGYRFNRPSHGLGANIALVAMEISPGDVRKVPPTCGVHFVRMLCTVWIGCVPRHYAWFVRVCLCIARERM